MLEKFGWWDATSARADGRVAQEVCYIHVFFSCRTVVAQARSDPRLAAVADGRQALCYRTGLGGMAATWNGCGCNNFIHPRYVVPGCLM